MTDYNITAGGPASRFPSLYNGLLLQTYHSAGLPVLYVMEYNEELEYKIVGSTEANSLKGKISNESPVGKALIGAKEGDVVEVETQAGTITYKVLEIQRSN